MPTYLKYALIVCVGALLFIPFIGQVHLFDWDEINFAECAREMIVTKDYVRAQIDFMPFWEKPPVFIWMQVLAMKIFGVGEFAARLPNAIVGIVTLATVFYVGKKVVNEKMAAWWVMAYIASWLPHFYFKTGIIDPTFNYFIFLAFFQVHMLQFSGRQLYHALLAGVFLGLAVLTKGPAAILIAMLALSIYLLLSRGQRAFKVQHVLVIAVAALIPFMGWLSYAVAMHGFEYGRWFMTEFITYQIRLFTTEDADHGGPFVYHFIVLLIGCFPASAFLFQYSRKSREVPAPQRAFIKWMWVMFWVVLILFSIVKTKIVHYSSLCYFPLTFLAALQMYRIADLKETMKPAVRFIFLGVGILIAVVLIAVPIVGLHKNLLVPIIDDPFAVGNLSAKVSWSYLECSIGVFFLVAVVALGATIKHKVKMALFGIIIVNVIVIQAGVLNFTSKIEAYSQRASIEFYEQFQGKDVYVHTLGFKSYAYLFYARKQPFADSGYYNNGMINEQWLMNGPIDRPVYFVCKVQNAAQYDKFPQLARTGEKNGFVFFLRKK